MADADDRPGEADHELVGGRRRTRFVAEQCVWVLLALAVSVGIGVWLGRDATGAPPASAEVAEVRAALRELRASQASPYAIGENAEADPTLAFALGAFARGDDLADGAEVATSRGDDGGAASTAWVRADDAAPPGPRRHILWLRTGDDGGRPALVSMSDADAAAILAGLSGSWSLTNDRPAEGGVARVACVPTDACRGGWPAGLAAVATVDVDVASGAATITTWRGESPVLRRTVGREGTRNLSRLLARAVGPTSVGR